MKTKTIKKAFLLPGVFFLFLFAILLNANTERDMGPPPELNNQLIHRYITFYTNLARVNRNLLPLAYDPALEKASVWQAEYCARSQRLTHYSSVRGMRDPGDRIKHFQGKWSFFGENVIVVFRKNMEGVNFVRRKDDKGSYRDFGDQEVHWRNERETAYRMVAQWMTSPGHRKNIVHTEFFSMGAGVAKGEFRSVLSYYGAQVFTDTKKWNFSTLSVRKTEETQYQIQYQGPLEVSVISVSGSKPPNQLETTVNGSFYEFSLDSRNLKNVYIALYDPVSKYLYPVRKIQ
jgi:uncharacterized protein YkwD